jgi:hypothetical protein
MEDHNTSAIRRAPGVGDVDSATVMDGSGRYHFGTPGGGVLGSRSPGGPRGSGVEWSGRIGRGLCVRRRNRAHRVFWRRGETEML